MDWSAEIGQALTEGVKQGFQQPNLRQQALECVQYKLQNRCMFGNLTLLHYNMYQGELESESIQVAAAVEALILALDMIDDLQDQDNDSPPWSKIRHDLALNIALGFVFLSQHMLLQSDFEPDRKSAAAALLNAQSLHTVSGQMTDLLNNIESEEQYIEMILGKSASLLVMACQVGTVLACGEIKPETREYAEQLGIAAQLKNDILDLTGNERKNDFWNRKRTLPVLLLLAEAKDDEAWMLDYFEGRASLEDVQEQAPHFQDRLERSGAIPYASVRMRVAYYRCLEIVENLSIDAPYKRVLLQTLSS
ncbi:polyprenyl synthetase family protein [Saccharibacillus sp. JS10]|uniref:polyprenyl synthetase family protein n=1 Tax=Saccharibacillus sp. JS10 TaxID=2950552 RepID=UPI002109823B|nr:polyprenyl synthetase family protein [Saccharibacillus sp. JS10]MCQ4087442.1 polyprenyl synthetase family protein [Saccharibacillus sp. JS10]